MMTLLSYDGLLSLNASSIIIWREFEFLLLPQIRFSGVAMRNPTRMLLYGMIRTVPGCFTFFGAVLLDNTRFMIDSCAYTSFTPLRFCLPLGTFLSMVIEAREISS